MGAVVKRCLELPVSSWGPREQNLGSGEYRWGSQGAVTPDKEKIKVGKPQKTLQLHPGCRLRQIHHLSHLPGVHLQIKSNFICHMRRIQQV